MMKLLHLLPVLNIYIVTCEWIEITPIENKQFGTKDSQETTTTHYENFVKTPILKSETHTTPGYLLNDYFFTDNSKFILDGKFNPKVSVFNMDTHYLNSSNEEYSEHETKSTTAVDDILPFLKTIQNNLLKFKKLHKSKMSVLKHLRDHLLNNIKQIIPHLWRSKVSSQARTYYEDDSHMDFPSNEGALMTIGFLTFAVFLIKLVIKLIHALKSKQQYYGMTTTTTAASVVFLKRKKREEEQEEMTKILQYIEEF